MSVQAIPFRSSETTADARAARPPLVLDLDGTLIRTDATLETLVLALKTRPLAAGRALLAGLRDRARMKAMLAEAIPLPVDHLPLNEPLALYASAERMAGREVHLVTGSHQSVADRLAARLPFLQTATGSTATNLKGTAKADWLAKRFPDGFVYAGDTGADGAVWAGASGGILVGPSKAAARAFRSSGCAEETRFTADRAGPGDWIRQLRLHQWAKNVLLFVAMFVGHVFADPYVWGAVVFGFLCMGAVASGTYVVNDLLDLEADRRHASKRFRPFASGRIPLTHGLLAGPGLIAGGLAASLILPLAFTGLLAIYLVLTLGYSVALKKTALFDTLALASLFTLRIAMGAALAGVALSQWLLVFSMFFFLSLSLAKRHGELARSTVAPDTFLPGRGYRGSDIDLTRSLGMATACSSVLILVLYLTEGAFATAGYASPSFLWALPVVFACWLSHLWLRADRGELQDDPVIFALRDRLSLGLAGACALAFTLALAV